MCCAVAPRDVVPGNVTMFYKARLATISTRRERGQTIVAKTTKKLNVRVILGESRESARQLPSLRTRAHTCYPLACACGPMVVSLGPIHGQKLVPERTREPEN